MISTKCLVQKSEKKNKIYSTIHKIAGYQLIAVGSTNNNHFSLCVWMYNIKKKSQIEKIWNFVFK